MSTSPLEPRPSPQVQPHSPPFDSIAFIREKIGAAERALQNAYAALNNANDPQWSDCDNALCAASQFCFDASLTAMHEFWHDPCEVEEIGADSILTADLPMVLLRVEELGLSKGGAA